MSGLLRVLLTPGCWLQNDPYNAAWDARLKKAMDRGTFRRIDRFEAEIDGLIVWVANHPYASFTPSRTAIKARPRRVTILAAGDRLSGDLWDEQSEEPTK